MRARYVRISTADQKLERQLISSNRDEVLYIDVCSGTVPFSERTNGEKLLNDAKCGKINYLSVNAVDRLGRNIIDILTTLEILELNKVTVKVENLGIESLINGKPNAAFKMIVSVLANVAEMERNNMLERQKAGIAIAVAKGKYKGRLRGTKEDSKEFLKRYPKVIKYLNSKNKTSLRDTAKLTDVSLGTVQKIKRLMEMHK